jgi:hypothetical protein
MLGSDWLPICSDQAMRTYSIKEVLFRANAITLVSFGPRYTSKARHLRLAESTTSLQICQGRVTILSLNLGR